MTVPAQIDTPPTTQPARRTRLGAGFLILGTVQFFVMHLIVQSAWTEPRYSWWSNYISDLGAVYCAPVLGNDVCSPLHAGMNASFILQGVLLLLGTALTARAWTGRVRMPIWQLMVAAAGVSWIVIGLIPEDVNLTGHSIGALPIFILGNVALIAAGLSKTTRTRPMTRRAGFVLGIIGLLGFVLTAVAIASPAGPIGIGIAERITVFPLQIWAVVAGISFLRHPRR